MSHRDDKWRVVAWFQAEVDVTSYKQIRSEARKQVKEAIENGTVPYKVMGEIVFCKVEKIKHGKRKL